MDVFIVHYCWGLGGAASLYPSDLWDINLKKGSINKYFIASWTSCSYNSFAAL